MSRIKLKNLLNLTEQAPVAPQTAPPQAAPAAPAPESSAPTDAMSADTAPTPEDPSEYDFTRDFRAFEDSKNKAEAAAKKKLLDKMNKILLGKKIVANASRGYGQPKTDYTIEKVKKVSVEFWYKDWAIIVSDENDKKFFLTNGVNIKIEQASAEQPEEPQQQNSPEEPQEPSVDKSVPSAQSEPTEPTEPTEEPEPASAGQAEKPNVPAPKAAVKPAAPTPQVAKPEPQQPKAPAEVPPLKKKKVAPQQPVAEEVSSETEGMKTVNPVDVRNEVLPLFFNFIGSLNRDFAKNFTNYVKKAVSGQDEDGSYNTEYIIEIPKDVIGKLDVREFQLFVRDECYHSGGAGQGFGRGNVDVKEIGINYIFTFRFSGGLDI